MKKLTSIILSALLAVPALLHGAVATLSVNTGTGMVSPTNDMTFRSWMSFTNGGRAGLRLANMTTAQRNAVVSPQNGMMIFNTTTGQAEMYNTGVWGAIGGGGALNEAIYSAFVGGLTSSNLIDPADLMVFTDPTGTASYNITYQNLLSGVLRQDNTIFVDVTYGNDSTGTRENASRPYKTVDAAFDAAVSGDMIVIRPGTYTLDGQIYSDDASVWAIDNRLANLSDITVIGYGAWLNVTNYGNGITLQNCTNITIEGLKFSVATNGWDLPGAERLIAAINHRQTNKNTVVRNCYFKDVADQAISHVWNDLNRPSTDWTIQNNVFENIGTDNNYLIGIADGACVSGKPRKMVFTGNRIINTVYGVELDGQDTEGLYPADSHGQTVVSGNVFTGVRYFGIVTTGVDPGGSVSSIDGLAITGNYFTNAPSRAQESSDIWLAGARNVTVVGNTFDNEVVIDDNTNTIHAISIGNLSPQGFCTSSNILISGNVIRGGSYGVSVTLNTNTAYKVNGVSIHGNTFMNQGEANVIAAGKNVRITDNQFLGAGRAGGTAPYAIWVYDFTVGALENCVIARNVLNDPNTGAGTGTARFLLAQSGAATKTTSMLVYDNEIISMVGTNAYSSTAGMMSVPVTSLLATDAIIPKRLIQRVVGNGGSVLMTSTPTINDAVDGTEITLIGTDNGNTVILQDNQTVVGSALELMDTARVLGDGDVIRLRYDRELDIWREMSFSETSTGSGYLVRATDATLTTPAIADFTSATHDHEDAAGGGTLALTAIPTALRDTSFTNITLSGTLTADELDVGTIVVTNQLTAGGLTVTTNASVGGTVYANAVVATNSVSIPGTNGMLTMTDGAADSTFKMVAGADMAANLYLDWSAIDDGEYLKRDGTNIVSDTPASAGDMEKATYDTDADDVVDTAATVEAGASITNIVLVNPADAAFTNLTVSSTATVAALAGAGLTGTTLTNAVLTTPAITFNTSSGTQADGTDYTVTFAGGTNTVQYVDLVLTNSINFTNIANAAAGRTVTYLLRAGATTTAAVNVNTSFHVGAGHTQGTVCTNAYALTFYAHGDNVTNVWVNGTYYSNK